MFYRFFRMVGWQSRFIFYFIFIFVRAKINVAMRWMTAVALLWVFLVLALSGIEGGNASLM